MAQQTSRSTAAELAIDAAIPRPEPANVPPPTAADFKLDPNRWFGHVEKAMPLLAKPRYARTARYGFCRCGEPVKYVSEIQRRYESYSNLIVLN